MAITEVGDAAPGWPTTGARRQGDRWLVASRNLLPARLAVLDLTDGRALAQHDLVAADGAWGLAVLDDDVYLGLHGTAGAANLQRLRGDRLDGVARLATGIIWDLAVLPDGRLLGVATGPPLVFTYSPATGRADDIGLLRPRQQPRTCLAAGDDLVVGGSVAAVPARAFLTARSPGGGPDRPLLPTALRDDLGVYASAATGDGRIVVGTTGPDRRDPAVAILDPSGGTVTALVRLAGESVVDAVTTDDAAVWAGARPSGALYRMPLAGGVPRRVAVPVPQSETRALAVVGDRVHGVSAEGSTWHHRAGTTRVVGAADAGLHPGPQRVQTLAATPRRVDVAGTFSVTRHHLQPDRPPTTRFLPGEAKAMIAFEDTTFLAVYPVAQIWAWPAEEDGPRLVAQLRPDQLRPIDMTWIPGTRHLAVTTTDDARHQVLHLVDPRTGAVRDLPDPLAGGGLAAVTAHDDLLLLGGSGPQPCVGAVDARTGAPRWVHRQALPDGGFVLGLQVLGGLIMATTTRGWAATLDLDGRRVRRTTRLTHAAGRLRRRGDRGLLSTADEVLAVQPGSLAAEVVADDLRGAFWGWPSVAVDEDGTVWVVRRRRLARLDDRIG